MTRREAIGCIKDVICENNTIKPNMVVFEQEKEALYMAIKALEQAPCGDAELDFVQPHKKIPVNLELCEDVVSRQAMNECIETYCGGAVKLAMELRKLPSVNPQPKTGHWIYTDYHTWCCSECGGNPHKGTGFTPNKDGMKMQWKYCNLCGTKMEG